MGPWSPAPGSWGSWACTRLPGSHPWMPGHPVLEQTGVGARNGPIPGQKQPSLMSLPPRCQFHVRVHTWFKLHFPTYFLGRQENPSFIDEEIGLPRLSECPRFPEKRGCRGSGAAHTWPATKDHVHDIWAATHGPQPGSSARSPPLLLSGRWSLDGFVQLGQCHKTRELGLSPP